MKPILIKEIVGTIVMQPGSTSQALLRRITSVKPEVHFLSTGTGWLEEDGVLDMLRDYEMLALTIHPLPINHLGFNTQVPLLLELTEMDMSARKEGRISLAGIHRKRKAKFIAVIRIKERQVFISQVAIFAQLRNKPG